jgi:hypothetical protein
MGGYPDLYNHLFEEYQKIMAIAHHPSVFVSSTCYDLAQVRKDLRAFIEAMGMTATMSEYSSFPVDPNLDAVGNCLGRVKDSADILVLLVGGRYGSPTETGKSVTNLEYAEAKAKGIPRYVFVDKRVLMTLPIWEKNPSADFSDIVDSQKLFEFVKSLRDPKENWVFPFESAQDIIETLRSQFAYLFKDCLDIRQKVARAGLSEQLQDLSGAALAIIVQKPRLWEYRLFSQIYADEVTRCSSLSRDLQYGITLGQAVRFGDLVSFNTWAQAKVSEIQSFATSAENLVNVALLKAVGPPGQPGNVEEIIYAAKRLGIVYRRFLEWTAEFRHGESDETFGPALRTVEKLSGNIISELEGFSRTLPLELEAAVKRYETTKQPQSVEITMKLTSACPEELDVELRKLAAHFGITY